MVAISRGYSGMWTVIGDEEDGIVQWMEMATIACGYLQRSKKVLPILD